MSLDWKNPKIAAIYKAGEKITGPFAFHLVKKAFDTPRGDGDLVTFDNACGTGVVTEYLYKSLSEAERAKIDHTCGDIAPGMIGYVEDRIERDGWSGTKTKIIDATKIDLVSETLSHILTNFGIVIILPTPTLPTALAETHRVLRPGGIAGFTVWKSTQLFNVLEEVVKRFGEGAPKSVNWEDYVNLPYDSNISPAERPAWHTLPYFTKALTTIGFIDINAELHSNTIMDTPEDYISNFGGMVKMIIGKWWSDEEKKAWLPKVDDTLREIFVIPKEKGGWTNEKGQVELVWEAWVITARKAST